MRSTLCTLVILTLWISQAPAQSAVLIGLHRNAWDDNQGMHPSSYRTFLVTFHNGKAQLAADIPDLIVPRKDAFWRVGALHKGPPRDGGYQEFIYASAVRSVPHAVGKYNPEPVPENPDSNCSPTNEATIEFVNPDLLSASYLTEPGCSLEVQFQHATYKPDELEKEPDIAAILGPAAWDAEKKAGALAKVKADKSPTASESQNRTPQIAASSALAGCLEARPKHGVSSAPSIHRTFVVTAIRMRSSSPFQNLSPDPPTTRVLCLSLLKSKVAKDNYILPGEAVLTPAGDFLMASGHEFSYGEAVRVYALKQQAIEPGPALSVLTSTSLGSGFNVAMVQWALGKHVPEWESELQSLRATHLPEPVVATGDPQH
jgi:hypothetical protein